MYSQDLKDRVLNFIQTGGSKAEASRRFSIGKTTLFTWLKQGADHKPRKPGPKHSRKFDEEELRQEVLTRPDRLLRELAQTRGVSIHAIFNALKKMGFRHKKTAPLQTKQTTCLIGVYANSKLIAPMI